MPGDKSHIVKIRCTGIKELVCDNCTASQASEDPWSYVVSETEKSMEDWDVLSVLPNE